MADPRITDILNLLDSIAGMKDEADIADTDDACGLIERLEARILSTPALADSQIMDRLYAIMMNGVDMDISRQAFTTMTALAGSYSSLAEKFAQTFSPSAVIDANDPPFGDYLLRLWQAMAEIASAPGNKRAAGVIASAFIAHLDADKENNSDENKERIEILGMLGASHPDHAQAISDCLIRVINQTDVYQLTRESLAALGLIGKSGQYKSRATADMICELIRKEGFSEKDAAIDALRQMGKTDKEIARMAMKACVDFLKARQQDENYITEKATTTIVMMADHHASLREDAIQAFGQCLQDKDIVVVMEATRHLRYFGLMDVACGKQAIGEFSHVLSDPALCKSVDLVDRAVSLMARIALVHPVFSGRVVEMLGQAMSNSNPKIREILTEGLIRLSQSDPQRWRNGLRDMFRRAAEACKVPREVAVECERRVDGELSSNISPPWDRKRAFEAARKLSL